MKKILFLISIVLLFSSSLYSQVDIPTFDKFVGTWEGTYPTGFQDYKNFETLTNKWIHKHNFFQMEIAGMVTDNPDYNFSSTCIYTLDKKNNIVGWLFDEGGYNKVLTVKGNVEGNVITLEGKGSSPEYYFKRSFELVEGKLVEKRSGTDMVPFEIVYTKK